MTAHIREARQNGVLELTMDRPEKKNALDPAMYRALAAAITEAGRDLETGAVILRGAGGAFTAGNDLAAFMVEGLAPAPDGGPPPALQAALDLLTAVSTTDAPLIAAVDGVAIGIGTTLLPHCDAAVAGPGARFQTPFVDLALCPEGASSVLFPARLGRAATRRLLMEGATLDASEALAAGLIDAIDVDPETRAREIAETLAAKPREAMRATKRLLREGSGDGVEAAILREGRVFAERLGSKEAQARFAAFFQQKAAARGERP